MAQPRHLFCLDLGQRTGFAVGAAGSLPVSGTVVLKKPTEPAAVALGNLLEFLRERWTAERPDLVVIEAPLSIAAMARLNNAEETMLLLHRLAGVVQAMTQRFAIRLVEVNSATARKHFMGRGSAGTREETKRAVVSRAVMLGYLPRGCEDDDRADACCVFDWAAATLCRIPPRELVMFGEARA
jgi:hypothetical protein